MHELYLVTENMIIYPKKKERKRRRRGKRHRRKDNTKTTTTKTQFFNIQRENKRINLKKKGKMIEMCQKNTEHLPKKIL